MDFIKNIFKTKAMADPEVRIRLTSKNVSQWPKFEALLHDNKIKIDKTGINEKTSNEGIIAPIVFLILSSVLVYGLSDKIYLS